MCSFQKEPDVSSFSIWRNDPTPQTANENILIIYQKILRPDINFLSGKQNRKPKIDQKMLKKWAGVAIFRHVLSLRRTNKTP